MGSGLARFSRETSSGSTGMSALASELEPRCPSGDLSEALEECSTSHWGEGENRFHRSKWLGGGGGVVLLLLIACWLECAAVA